MFSAHNVIPKLITIECRIGRGQWDPLFAIANLFFPDLFYLPKNEILSRWIVEEDDCAVIAIRRKRSLSFLIVCFRYQSPPIWAVSV